MKMKGWVALAAAALLMNAGLNPAEAPRLTLLGGATAQAAGRVDYGFFYNQLAPYGDWRRVQPYGWAWYPDTEPGWRPYTVGSWLFTDDYGWTWASTDPWGSIPFHYGRWFYDRDYRGWAWVPGTEWGPAWVSWRTGNGFIGWAPLPPEITFDRGTGFSPSDRDFGISRNTWSFVPVRRFLSPRIERVLAPRPRTPALLERTENVTRYSVVDRRVVNRSIDLDRFENETRNRVTRYRVDEADRPVIGKRPAQDGRIIVYRPEVEQSTAEPPRPSERPRRHGRQAEDRFEGRDAQRQQMDEADQGIGQERPGRVIGREQRPQIEQGQMAPPVNPVNEERPKRQAEREQLRQQQIEQEKAQRQAEREQARQQQVDQEKAQRQAERQAQRQAEQEAQRQAEQAQRQAERQAQRQAEQEQARQQALRQQQLQQEQARQRAEQARAQQAAQEAAQRQAEAQRQAQQEAQKQAEQAQRQAQQEAQRQAEQAQRQAERQAQRQAEREAQRQAEQAQRQADRQADRQAERERRRNLPECASLPPGQQQECR